MRVIWSSQLSAQRRLIHRFLLCLITMHLAHGNSHIHLCSTTGTSNSSDLLSHCVTQENHLEFFSTLCKEEANTMFQFCLKYEPHTQLMGSLLGRLNHSVSWRISHAVVIIDTPSQLGRHSPSDQVSHESTRTLS
jgi:hypothetical protein